MPLRHGRSAVAALYAVALTVKFSATPSEHPLDVAVMSLGGLSWADDHADFVNGIGSSLLWAMMIQRPEELTDEVIAAASTTGSTSVTRDARHPGSGAPSCTRR